MEATPERRAERNYEIGHSQGSFCMPRCKNTSDVFVAPVFTGCNETSNWKLLSAATSYARSPIVCTVHTQSFQSRFCCSVLPIPCPESRCCSLPFEFILEKTMSGIRERNDWLKRVTCVPICTHSVHPTTPDRFVAIESSEERAKDPRSPSYDTSSRLV